MNNRFSVPIHLPFRFSLSLVLTIFSISRRSTSTTRSYISINDIGISAHDAPILRPVSTFHNPYCFLFSVNLQKELYDDLIVNSGQSKLELLADAATITLNDRP